MQKPKKLPRDANSLAARIVAISTEQDIPESNQVITGKGEKEKNPAAVALGRLGGLKGGNARAQSLTGKKRSAIAKKAAAARWGKKA